MKKIALLLSLVAGAFFASQSQAQMMPPRSSGPYAGIGVLSTFTNNAKDFGVFSNGFGGGGDDSATGFKAYGGYLWPNRFGVEVGYYDLGSYDVKSFGAKTDEFSVNAFSVSGVFALPFGRNFDFNAKLGIAFTNVDYTCIVGCGGSYFNTSKSGTAGLFGAGVGWRVAPNFGLRADYEWFGGVKHTAGINEATYDYGVLSVSGQVKF